MSVVQRACMSDHEIGQSVIRVGKFEDLVTREATHGLLRAGDVAAQRMSRPHQLLKEIYYVFLRLVLVTLQLLQDHGALALDVRGVQLRVRHEVKQDVESEVRMHRRHARPVSGQLPVGRRVDETSDTFDRVGDLFRRGPPLRALEVEMLDEMRDTGEPVVFEWEPPPNMRTMLDDS